MSHALAERTSRALHAAVAEKLRRARAPGAVATQPEGGSPALGAEDPAALVARARTRIEDGLAAHHPEYAAAWLALLDRPLPELAAALEATDQTMDALRQCSPFAGALTPRERWAIWRAVRANGAPSAAPGGGG